mmetsp:Transcript_11644/g.43408  ORF Transcript_11644/g.43408 Transcript_11644/m.43408 type:complete len:250 (+) Transcript_11644:841-1590(+)
MHPILQVLEELDAVLAEADDLLAQRLDVLQVALRDLRAGAGHGGVLEHGLDVGVLQDVAEVHIGAVGAHAHLPHAACVLDGVVDDLLHLREVPAVPLLRAHGVGVDLLVEVVQQAHRLHNHGVHLVRRELQLVPAERVRQAQLHRPHGVRLHRRQQRLHLVANAAIELQNRRAVHAADAQLLLDHAAQLGVHHCEVVIELLLHHVLVEELLQPLVEGALHQRGGRRHRLRDVIEARERLELHERVRAVS